MTTTTWLTSDDVRRKYDVGHNLLTTLMRLTDEASIKRCWVNRGTPKRPHFAFDPEDTDRWWKEITAWRSTEGSSAARSSIKLSGETATAKSEASRVQRRRARTSTSSELRTPKTSDSTTTPNLSMLTFPPSVKA
jgi:hypothetical protein